MKKRVWAILLSTVMAATFITACGGDDSEGSQTAEATVTETAEATEEADDSTGDMVSDETFAVLQDNFATLSANYDAVLDFYYSDEIAADETIEDLLTQSAEVINQMGELTQEEITEADAEALNNVMLELSDALSEIVSMMKPAEDASEDYVSDETFAALQENYNSLVDTYTMVVEYYNSDAVKANADVEKVLNQAAAYIEQMGEITQDSITEADAVELNNSMLSVMDALATITDVITKS